MTNASRVVLYTGITNSLERRYWFHHHANPRSFTKTYKVDRLVYYEVYHDVRDAIAREKQIKSCRREKKDELIKQFNPKWKDLGKELVQQRIPKKLEP